MPKEVNYARISDDGRITMVKEITDEREITPAFISTLTEDVMYSRNKVFNTSIGGTAGLIIKKSETWAYARLKYIMLRCPFERLMSGLIHPLFKIDDGEHPVMAIEWPVPESMVAIFTAKIHQYGGAYQTKADRTCFLFAFDTEGRCYKLPLPNLYSECDLCMGEFTGTSETMNGAFDMALTQFLNSSWNSDLVGLAQSASEPMFSFKTTDVGFEPIPCDKWEQYCQKISTPMSQMIGGLR